jgi:hypothetical protein
MFEIPHNTRYCDAFRAAHEERGEMVRAFLRAFRR